MTKRSVLGLMLVGLAANSCRAAATEDLGEGEQGATARPEAPKVAPSLPPPPAFAEDPTTKALPDACADNTKDVFVISDEGSLLSFHPPTLTFKGIGRINCPTGDASPTSMAVDRAGFAWVRYSDGSIWRVSTNDLACEPTAHKAPVRGDGAPFFRFGMGFSRSSTGDELYLSDSAGTGLGRLDTSTMQITPVGPYTGDLTRQAAELTGTGDGKLYGFFVTSPARIAEISKETGSIVSEKELPGVSAGDGWAFSFYGGDFYIYTSAKDGNAIGDGTGSDITRYRPSTGSVEVLKSKIGFRIVGAGVSTCAPTSSPR